MTQTPDDLLTAAEVADLARVTPEAVYQWVRNGALAATRVGVGHGVIRIRRADAEEFVNRPAATRAVEA